MFRRSSLCEPTIFFVFRKRRLSSFDKSSLCVKLNQSNSKKASKFFSFWAQIWFAIQHICPNVTACSTMLSQHAILTICLQYLQYSLEGQTFFLLVSTLTISLLFEIGLLGNIDTHGSKKNKNKKNICLLVQLRTFSCFNCTSFSTNQIEILYLVLRL